MSKYSVCVLVHANYFVDVEADSPEEAAEKAYDKYPGSICHQCSDEYDIGDAYQAIVSDEDGTELYDDGPAPPP